MSNLRKFKCKECVGDPGCYFHTDLDPILKPITCPMLDVGNKDKACIWVEIDRTKQDEGECVLCDAITKNPPERICGKCAVKIAEAI